MKGGDRRMNFQFFMMTQSDAEQIALWHYDGEFSFYDMENDPDDLRELLSPDERADSYWSAYSDGVLTGFVCIQPNGSTAEIGLGLRPDLTGKGLGSSFLQAIEQLTQCLFPAVSELSLAVAAFNLRAQKVYKRAGFLMCGQKTVETNGGQYPFVRMKKQLSTANKITASFLQAEVSKEQR